MTDPAPTNGTIPGAISRLGQSLITALPSQFLMLVLINAGFLGLVLWFLTDQMDSRTALAGKIVDHCLVGQTSGFEAAIARLDALEHDVRALETKGDHR